MWQVKILSVDGVDYRAYADFSDRPRLAFREAAMPSARLEGAEIVAGDKRYKVIGVAKHRDLVECDCLLLEDRPAPRPRKRKSADD